MGQAKVANDFIRIFIFLENLQSSTPNVLIVYFDKVHHLIPALIHVTLMYDYQTPHWGESKRFANVFEYLEASKHILDVSVTGT